MAVPVPIPVIDDLPPAPRRNDGPPDFVLKADAMIASLHPLVAQINIALQWISGQLTDTQASEKAAAVSAKAAADSAASAAKVGAQHVEQAVEQAVLAGRAREGAEAALASTKVVAAAVESAAGFPELAGHNGHALRVKIDGAGVEFAEVGQEIGDVLITRRSTPPPGYVLPGTVYAQAAYPELFALTGIREVNNDGANFSTLMTPPFDTAMDADIACGLDNVFIAIHSGKASRSTDGGLSWVPIAGLGVSAAMNRIATDCHGYWLISAAQPHPLLYRSTDNGMTWTTVKKTFDLTMTVQSISGGEPGVFVMLVYKRTTGYQYDFWLSTDGGATWAEGYSTTVSLGLSIATDGKGFWMASPSSDVGIVSYDNFATAINYPNISEAISGGGVILGRAAHSRASIVIADSGMTSLALPGIGFNETLVDRAGCIHAYQNTSIVYRSYDQGETWSRFTVIPSPLDKRRCAMSGSGIWITGRLRVWSRSTRLYNYDKSTQFKTPHAKAPFGLYAYIKAKKV